MASGGPSIGGSIDELESSAEPGRASSQSRTSQAHPASTNKKPPPVATASRIKKVQSGSSARLIRVEFGVDQIIAMLSRLQLMRVQNAPPSAHDDAADSPDPTLTPRHQQRQRSKESLSAAASVSAAAASTDGYSSSRHASCESVREGGAGDSAFWRRRSAELQDTVDMLVGRLEQQAAQLDARLEAAADERQELGRRLGSFRRQLDASQAARARLRAELTAAEAELARLRQIAGCQDVEETVEALTAQLDRSNQQLLDMRRSGECLRQRADKLQTLIKENGGGGGASSGGGLSRSCSCDQQLHECCRRDRLLEPGEQHSEQKQRPSTRQHLRDQAGGNVSEPGDIGRSSKSFRQRLLRRKPKTEPEG